MSEPKADAQSPYASGSYRRVAIVAGLAAALIAVVALIGWATGFYPLARIRADYIPMAQPTAMAFFLLGLALAFSAYERGSRRQWADTLAAAVAALVLIYVLLQLIEAAFDFDLELSLRPVPIAADGEAPVNRMSLVTAFAFAATCLAQIMLAVSRQLQFKRSASRLACLVAVTGAVISVGYLYGTPFLYGGSTVPVAINTGFAFVLLGIGLTAAAGPGHWPLSAFTGTTIRARLMRTFLPLTLVVLLFQGWFIHQLFEIGIVNPAFASAVTGILFLLFMGLLLARLAMSVGGSIDLVIFEREQAEAARRASEDKYRTLFEESMDVIFISSAAGQLVDINPIGVELLECESKEECLATDSREFFPVPADLDEFLRELEQNGFVRDYELQLTRKGGQPLNLLVTATAVRDEAGRIVSHQGIARDVTEQKTMERQLLEMQKLEAIGLLAGGIAHDFNNQIMVIKGNAELALMDTTESNPLYETLTTILESSKKTAALTQQLLAFSRRQVLNPEVINVADLISNLRNILPPLIRENVELNLEVAPDLGSVYADESTLEQVIMNLAVNARDAMPDGGPLLIKAENRELDRTTHRRHTDPKPGKYVQISVIDHGVGMDEDTVRHVFEPFFTMKEGGTGLGLSIVYGTIRQQGGYVTVTSRPGSGSRFDIYLPLYQLEAAAARTVTTMAEIPRGSETILVAEDEEGVLQLLKNFLEMLGYQVITARDGEEALAQFDLSADQVDLAILDAIMPRLSGPKAYEAMRAKRPELPFIFITGYSDEISKKFFDHEQSVLRKPITLPDLGTTVRQVLDRQHRDVAGF